MQDKIWTLKEFKKESNLGLFYRRSNPYLIEIDHLLKEYESLSKDLVETEVNALLMISNACKKYIDRRPASHRGGAVLVLYTQTIHLAELLTKQHVIGQSLGHGLQGWARARAAVKPLLQGVAGSNGKAHYILDENYWPEMIIENHFPLSRPTFYGSSPMTLWKSSGSHLNFIDWLREYYIPHLINQGSSELLWERLSQGVSYLDSAQRADKLIYIRNGIIYNSRHENFHTGNMETNTMGKGWAIFVMAPDNNIYANTHKIDVFHHSSFLSSGAVQAAGEIAVDNGHVVGITNRSGHYKPNQASIVRILYWLKQHGVSLSGIAASPGPPSFLPLFYDAQEVWSNGGVNGTQWIPRPRVSPTIN